MARRYVLVVTKSQACHACHQLEAQGLFNQLTGLKAQGVVDDVYTYNFSTLGPATDQSQLFNMNLFFPNFKLMPEDVYHAAVNGVTLTSLINQVYFYNTIYDPSEPFLGLREQRNYSMTPTVESVTKFCRDSIGNLQYRFGYLVPASIATPFTPPTSQYNYWYYQR